MMIFVGTNVHEEWLESSDVWYVNKNYNTIFANQCMMSVLVMNIHK